MKYRSLAAGFATVATLAVTGMAVAGRARVFTDVPASFWARDEIEWAAANHIMGGPGGQDQVFNPASPTNRAEMAAIAFRLHQDLSADIDLLRERILALELAVHGKSRERDDDEDGPGEDTWDDAERSSSSMSRSSVRYVSSAGHSAASQASMPAGVQIGRVLFTGALGGSAEVPSVESQGRGNFRLWWTEDGLWYDSYVTSLSSPITGAHFHLGATGVEGDILELVSFDHNNRARGLWSNLTTQNWKDLTMNNVYFNVHTEKNPDGEVRGQVFFHR